MLNLEIRQKGSQFKIEDPARYPGKTLKPNFLMIIGMSVMVGLGVGIGGVLAFDIFDALPIESNYKFMVDLNENPERIILNYELMDLETYCDEAIGEENIQDIRAQMGDVAW